MVLRVVVAMTGALVGSALAGTPSCSRDLVDETLAGTKLTSQQAAALEQQLDANPQDLNSRARLFGYYSFGQDRGDRAGKTKHILWFIRNAPEAEVLEWPILLMDDREGYAEAREAWLQQIGNDPRNVVFLRHAANFFTLTDPELSAELLERGEGLAPTDSHWAERRGQLHWLAARDSGDGWNSDEARRALADYERAYGLADASGRGYLLTALAEAAFVAGELEKARTYAEEVIESIPNNWNYGNRVHLGNLVLGRIALAHGDLKEAGARLLAAGRTPGSPQLNTLGPDMALAERLLDRGAAQTVTAYLELCLDFWESGQDELKEWTVLIEAGRTPDFSFNLRF